MVAQRVGVAGRVAIAGLEDDLVVGAGAQGGVLVAELPAGQPAHGAGGCRLQVKAALDRGAVDVMIEVDLDRGRGRDVDGVALWRVVHDLRRVAAACVEQQAEADGGPRQKSSPPPGPSLTATRPARARRSRRRPPPRRTAAGAWHTNPHWAAIRQPVLPTR